MPTDTRHRLTVALGGLWGLALVVAPTRLIRSVGADPGAPYLVPVARVLGARHLAQALVLTGVGARWSSGRPVTRLAAATDGLHSASMLALAAVAPAYRRAALLSAATAASLAAVTAFGGKPSIRARKRP